MASAAKSAMEAAAVVLSLDPNDIEIGERLGAFWPDKAAAIGRLIAEDGQNEPIKVKRNGSRAGKPWALVAGHHRLIGVQLEELRAIDAIEVFGDEAAIRRIEASENVERGSRSPIERACFVRAIADAAEARLKDQHQGLSAEQIAIRARWDAMKSKAVGVEREDDLADAEAANTSANLAVVYGWAEQTAEALGMSQRAMFRDLALHRALVAPFPDLYRKLATHPTVGENASALRDIASYALDSRRALVEALAETPELTLAAAKEGLGLTSPSAPSATGATKFMNGTMSNLRNLSAGDQARIAPEIVKTMKPSALLALREALDARIKAEGIDA